MEMKKENNINDNILPLTSPIYSFNPSTVQPTSPLIGLTGPTSPVDRSTTDIFNLIPIPSNTHM